MRKPNYRNLFADAESGSAKAEMADVEWASIVIHLADVGLLTDQRKRLADRLVRARVEYEFTSRDVMIEGAIRDTEQGTQFYNYKASYLMKQADTCLKLETALGMTVKDNERAGKPSQSKKVIAADEFLEDRPN